MALWAWGKYIIIVVSLMHYMCSERALALYILGISLGG